MTPDILRVSWNNSKIHNHSKANHAILWLMQWKLVIIGLDIAFSVLLTKWAKLLGSCIEIIHFDIPVGVNETRLNYIATCISVWFNHGFDHFFISWGYRGSSLLWLIIYRFFWCEANPFQKSTLRYIYDAFWIWSTRVRKVSWELPTCMMGRVWFLFHA